MYKLFCSMNLRVLMVKRGYFIKNKFGYQDTAKLKKNIFIKVSA